MSTWTNWLKNFARTPRTRRASRKTAAARTMRRPWALLRLEDRLVPTATVWTDKLDYAPGSTAQILGDGWQLGETVQLQVLRTHQPGTPGLPGSSPWFVTAGGAGDLDLKRDGKIESNWYVDPIYTGATLELTASGDMGSVADPWVFTDGNAKAAISSAVNGDSYTLTWSR